MDYGLEDDDGSFSAIDASASDEGDGNSDDLAVHDSARIPKRKQRAAEASISLKRQKTTNRPKGGYKSKDSRVSLRRRVVVPGPIADPGTSKQYNSSHSPHFTFLDTYHCDCAAFPVSDHPKKRCNVLEYFDLYYSSAIDAIICHKHGCAVTLDRWSKHLLADTRSGPAHGCSNPKARKRKELDAMQVHIEESFQPAASYDALVLPASLPDILPMASLYEGVRPPILARYPCPVPECSSWIAISTNKTSGYEHDLRKHVQDVHKSSLSEYPHRSKTPAWTQMLRLTPHMYHVFQLPKGWEPPTNIPSYPPPLALAIPFLDQGHSNVASPSLPLQASWMHRLGWDSYRATMPWSDTFIRRVLEIPSSSLASCSRGSLKWLESGLKLIRDILPDYLSNANLFLDGCHPNIRAAINGGYVFNFSILLTVC